LSEAQVIRLLSLELRHFLPYGGGYAVLGITGMEDKLAATTQRTIRLCFTGR